MNSMEMKRSAFTEIDSEELIEIDGGLPAIAVALIAVGAVKRVVEVSFVAGMAYEYFFGED